MCRADSLRHPRRLAWDTASPSPISSVTHRAPAKMSDLFIFPGPSVLVLSLTPPVTPPPPRGSPPNTQGKTCVKHLLGSKGQATNQSIYSTRETASVTHKKYLKREIYYFILHEKEPCMLEEHTVKHSKKCKRAELCSFHLHFSMSFQQYWQVCKMRIFAGFYLL